MPQPGETALTRLNNMGFQVTTKKISDKEYIALIPPAVTHGSGKSPELAIKSLLCSVLKRRIESVAS